MNEAAPMNLRGAFSKMHYYLAWPAEASHLAAFCSALGRRRALAGGWTQGAGLSLPNSSPLSPLAAWP